MIKPREPVTLTVTERNALRNAARQKAWRERQKDAKKALVDIWADFHETVSADG